MPFIKDISTIQLINFIIPVATSLT